MRPARLLGLAPQLVVACHANATPPMDMFDFANPPFMTPPNIAAHTVSDPVMLARCNQVPVPEGCADQWLRRRTQGSRSRSSSARLRSTPQR